MTKEELKSFFEANFSLEEVRGLLLRAAHGESAEFYYMRANNHVWNGDYQEAIKTLNKGLSFNDHNFNVKLYAKRARFQEKLDVIEAAADYSKAWSLIDKSDNSGFNHKLVLDYAQFLHRQKQNNLAKDIIENAFRLPELDNIVDQNNFLSESFYIKARISFATGKLDQSNECLGQARKHLDLKMRLDEEDLEKDFSIETYELVYNFEPLDKEIQKVLLSRSLNKK